MSSDLSKVLHVSATLGVAVAALAATVTLAGQTRGSSRSQASLTISAFVKPSCVFDVTPVRSIGAAVAVQCQGADLAHARIRVENGGPASIGALRMTHVSGPRTTMRFEVRDGSLLQIDF